MATAHVISIGDCGGACLLGIFPVNNFEIGFSGFRGLQRKSSVWVYGLIVTHRLFGVAIVKVYNFTLRP
jgi:hypothetical protein